MNLNEIDEDRPLRPQLYHNHSIHLDHESGRSSSPAPRSGSLPKGLTGVQYGSKGNLSPLVRGSSRHSFGRQATFETDAGSELFKRTPIDLMKQHASLLTNILCLAITLSLVLVTVVQFSGNEERWRQYAATHDRSYGNVVNVATEQTMSIEEMENLLFGDYNGTIDYNFTTVGHSLMQNILSIKKWHADNNELLGKLIKQSHEIISAKDTVFGIGGRPGVKSRLDELERDFNQIQDHLQGEISNLKSKLQRLSKSIEDTKTLIQVQVSETQSSIIKGNKNADLINKITPQMKSMEVDVKSNNATIKELSKNINSLAEIWAASLKNMTEIEKKINDISD